MAVVDSGVGSKVIEDRLAVGLADADGVTPANDSIIDFYIYNLSD